VWKIRVEPVSFCLLGGHAADLIKDARMTPFNIGRRITLNDFTTEEAAPLANGLGRDAFHRVPEIPQAKDAPPEEKVRMLWKASRSPRGHSRSHSPLD
jgi:hypothetical protein